MYLLYKVTVDSTFGMSRDLGTQAAIRVHGQHALACELVLACGERGLGGPHGPVGAGGIGR